MENIKNQKILFFDGICGLCQKALQFFLRHDKHQHLFYSPLQGETFQRLDHIKKPDVDDVLGEDGTLVYYANGKIFTRSDAALRALCDLGGLWRLAVILKFIPRSVRDYFYKIVARHRYEWFGKSQTCYFPSPSEAKKFLP